MQKDSFMAARKTTPLVKAAASKKRIVAKAARSAAKPVHVPKAANKAAVKVKPSPAKTAKPAKVKLIRDSFTMPSYDYDLIATLKSRALDSKAVLKKSELLRAGLHALSKLESKQLVALVSTLTVVKTGRPKH
jgi:hypothetical protein